MTGKHRFSAADRDFLLRARRVVLGTIAPDGRPRLVPMAFAVSEAATGDLVLYSALDEKPKSVADPHDLARVRDVQARPRVSVIADEWDEDWSRLAWLRLDGTATIIEAAGETAGEHAAAILLLRQRYPQYTSHRLEQRPVMRIEVERVASWSAEP